MRLTGVDILVSNNVHEAMDMALIAKAASMKSRIPFIHFIDGFRTSHTSKKNEEVTADIMRVLLNDNFIIVHLERALSSDNPFIRGTAQNPDVIFQSREATNLYYGKCQGIVQDVMSRFSKLTGRHIDYKVQGYFVYNSKKAGATTSSHLRFGQEPIRSACMIDEANFIGCHQTGFLEKPVVSIEAPEYVKSGIAEIIACSVDQPSNRNNQQNADPCPY